ncbi:alginate export family protein [Flavobacterium sp. MR2016-29]|uniref:alginate export family protein n=1 Tax=Flavobacterium sp. MR2016-29 TaxID=2783795 RepID=UPI00188A9FB2|nr:alginate export family protein [Flavobacterium sp. MR2016-29]MBF4493031.1 alginate export family protein [Flavobacterium sp. MR2016-29]
MKNKILLVILMLSFSGFAQRYPDFKSLRFDENYGFLKNDTVSNGWYKTVKFLPVSASKETYISFGGDIRFQYFYAKNENWGDGPQDNDGYVLGRYLFHADFHAGKFFRTFVQTQSSMADGRIDPNPVEQNPLEVHQAFADFNIINEDSKKLILRVGRQELTYGSQRLVAVREGPNNRQSFDGIKAIVSRQNFTTDFFYTHYVVAHDGIFDDASNKDRQLWGSYFVFNKIPAIKNIDVYYLGYERANAAFNDASGKENRQSVGTRIWGKTENWRYDGEAVYQFGTVGAKNISAWTASINAGYRFNAVKFRPEIGFKTEVISGDKTAGDTSLQTFNPLFPRGAYFGLASLIGPSNLIDFHPSLSFEVAKNVDWVIDYDMFWRYSSNDGIYAPNTTLIYPGDTTTEKKIGNQLESEIIWEPNQYLYFRLEATWFQAREYIQASGTGKNIFFTGITMQLHF